MLRVEGSAGVRGQGGGNWGHEMSKPRVKHRFGFVLFPQKSVLGKGIVGSGLLLLSGELCELLSC